MSGTVYILSAPSGAGKSTLAKHVREMFPEMEFSVSYTTRPKRGNEQHGREYFFVTREEFDAMGERGEFLEFADVFGNLYGTSRRVVEETIARGRDLLLDIDVQGALQVKERLREAGLPDPVTIFILPPSRKELENRLRARSQAEGVLSEAVIQRRLDTASREIENYPQYGYILVNDRLEQSIEQLKAIVLAERAKRSPAGPAAGDAKFLAAAEACMEENARPRVRHIVASFTSPVSVGTEAEGKRK